MDHRVPANRIVGEQDKHITINGDDVPEDQIPYLPGEKEAQDREQAEYNRRTDEQSVIQQKEHDERMRLFKKLIEMHPDQAENVYRMYPQLRQAAAITQRQQHLIDLVMKKSKHARRDFVTNAVSKLNPTEVEEEIADHEKMPDIVIPQVDPRLGKTMQALAQRVNQQEFQQYVAEHGLEDDPESAVEYYLKDTYSIQVRSDGLVEFWKLEPGVEEIIGDLPVLLWHHTSSKLLPKIKREGLRSDVRKRSNPYMNSRAGVYLTTESGGNACDGYCRNACSTHGGDPIAIGVRTTLQQVQPDPDDADISSGSHQFFIPYVSPQDIVEVS